MNAVRQLKAEIERIADQKRAKLLQRYFKTGKGEYGEGDIFLGITVPQSRKIAIKFENLDFASIEKLLHSKLHEERLIALLILVNNFSKGSDPLKKKIYDFYLNNTKYINNWDLVDLSAPNIVGNFLWNKQRGPSSAKASAGKPVENNPILIKLAKSESIWERRIAVLSTFRFIKENQFRDSLKIAKMLLKDDHDLIQKAVGWMLREIGKRDLETEIEFLNKHYQKMPRTMLRCSIEKFPEKLKMFYLKK